MIIFETSSNAIISRVDPRVRILLAILFAAIVCISSHPATLIIAATLALTAVILARLSPIKTLKRLRSLNLLMLALLILLPLSHPGDTALTLGPLIWTTQGIAKALLITCRANLIMLTFAGLLATMETTTFAAALDRLRVPNRFTHTLLFMIRYIEVIHQEYHRLANAMKLRGFKPHCNKHTFKTFGYFIGMLLVKSLDRSERILSAMKCRAFTGRFYVLIQMKLKPADIIITTLCLAIAATMIWIETL